MRTAKNITIFKEFNWNLFICVIKLHETFATFLKQNCTVIMSIIFCNCQFDLFIPFFKSSLEKERHAGNLSSLCILFCVLESLGVYKFYCYKIQCHWTWIEGFVHSINIEDERKFWMLYTRQLPPSKAQSFWNQRILLIDTVVGFLTSKGSPYLHR